MSTTTEIEEIELTEDQQAALDKFVVFLMDPVERVFVLRGYSGTGKSTLIHTLMKRLPTYIKASQLIDPDYECPPIALTATTHKAAENFSQITGMEVGTIHSFLGLRLHTDYTTGAKTLVPSQRDEKKCGYLIFIDEASYIDSHLLGLVFQQTQNCKIVFIGDPAQLLMPRASHAPVFASGFTEAMLTKVMRQTVNGVPQSNPITELATAFRHTVETGEWPKKVKPDGEYVIWLPRNDFIAEVEKEFTRDDWSYKDSKVLAWTNERVIAYNKHIRQHLKGDPALAAGDYAENNSYIKVGNNSLQTDRTVYINKIEDDTTEHGVLGNWVTVENSIRVFHPRYRDDKKQLVAKLRSSGQYQLALEVENWIDLRAVFAQTVNKSQGSTYDKVFIDLDDFKRCNMGNLIARMMYVGISRGRKKVYLTGDLV